MQYTSPTKHLVRELLLNLPVSGRGRLLSFGGPLGTDLKMFANRGFQVLSLERNRVVYDHQRTHLRDPAITLRKDSLERYVEWFIRSDTDEEPFSIAFLDFCGPYTAKREEAIGNMLKYGLVAPGGYLGLTFTEARETPHSVQGSRALGLARTWTKLIDNRATYFQKAIQSRSKRTPLDHWSTIRYLNKENNNSHMSMMFMCCRVGAD